MSMGNRQEEKGNRGGEQVLHSAQDDVILRSVARDKGSGRHPSASSTVSPSTGHKLRRLHQFYKAVVFAFALAALGGCGGRPEAVPRSPERVSGIRVATVRVESVPNEIEVPGTVASVRTAQIAARTMGTVENVLVREGDRVRAGQLLVQLDEREMLARQHSARAAMEEATAAREEAERSILATEAQAGVIAKTFERMRALREQRAVAPQEFDEAEAKHQAAAANLEAARAHQRRADAAYARAQSENRAAETAASYSRIVAPFDGVVLRRTVDPGSMATPGQPLLVVEDASQYRLEVTINLADAAGIVRGSKARVQLDSLPDRQFAGIVSELEGGADPLSQTARVRVDLPRDPRLRSGAFGRAWFQRGERKVIAAPRSAIIERGQLHGLYIVDPAGVMRWRVITLGQNGGDRAEVLSGLSDGDRIVLDPENRELDGKVLEAAP